MFIPCETDCQGLKSNGENQCVKEKYHWNLSNQSNIAFKIHFQNLKFHIYILSEKTLTESWLADIMQKEINVLGISANNLLINLASELIFE